MIKNLYLNFYEDALARRIFVGVDEFSVKAVNPESKILGMIGQPVRSCSGKLLHLTFG